MDLAYCLTYSDGTGTRNSGLRATLIHIQDRSILDVPWLNDSYFLLWNFDKIKLYCDLNLNINIIFSNVMEKWPRYELWQLICHRIWKKRFLYFTSLFWHIFDDFSISEFVLRSPKTLKIHRMKMKKKNLFKLEFNPFFGSGTRSITNLAANIHRCPFRFWRNEIHIKFPRHIA